MNSNKIYLTHAIFFLIELIIAPVAAYAAAYASITVVDLSMFFIVFLIFFGTFMILIGIIGYIHFKCIEEPNFRTALFRGLIGLILAIALLAAQDLYKIRVPDYLKVCVLIFGTVGAFNSVLFFRKR